MKGKKKAVYLPEEIYHKIEQRVADTEFDSVDEYIAFVLAEVLKENDEEDRSAYSKEDEEEVKKRLRALGYLG